MTFIANHLWILPLTWTIIVFGLYMWFAITVEGEDTMAIPLVMLAALVAIFGAWGIYGLYHFVRWLL